MYLRSTPEKPIWICTSGSPLVIGTKHDVHIATALEDVIRTRMSGSVDEKFLWKKYNHPASLPHALQKFRKTGSSSLSAEIGKFESLNCMVWQKDREEHCLRTSPSSRRLFAAVSKGDVVATLLHSYPFRGRHRSLSTTSHHRIQKKNIHY